MKDQVSISRAGRTAQTNVGVASGSPIGSEEATQSTEKQIPIDGFNQVLEMLKAADADFRESLLRRMSARDARLVSQLRRELAAFGL